MGLAVTLKRFFFFRRDVLVKVRERDDTAMKACVIPRAYSHCRCHDGSQHGYSIFVLKVGLLLPWSRDDETDLQRPSDYP